VRPVGFQKGKAQCLRALASFVVTQFKTEAAFCAGVTWAQLRGVTRIGPETADRILLYTCGRLAWPVDTYCFRVLAHHGVIPSVPDKKPAKTALAVEIKRLVNEQMAGELDDWQRLHALMQLEGRTSGGGRTRRRRCLLSCETGNEGLLEQMVTAGIVECAGGWRAVLKKPLQRAGACPSAGWVRRA